MPTAKMRFLTLLLLLGLWNPVIGENKTVIEYEISYMSIPVLDMTMTREILDSTVQISYDNKLKPFIAAFHRIHNIYRVRYNQNNYAPLDWSKKISEGSMNFYLEGVRSQDLKQVEFSNGVSRAFPEDAFTVFSATHFLASKAHDPTAFPMALKVFIDGEVWQAQATRFTRQHPHPEIEISGSQILIQTKLHYLEGSRIMESNDILMAEIASEGTQFLLWVEPDGDYSKAQFGKFPKAVVLNRVQR